MTPESNELFKTGDILADRYKLVSRLGTGGMGVVYKVLDLALEDEPVALKILSPEFSSDPVFLGRFENEVVLARRLSHPNIVRIYDIGEADSLIFFSMEFIPGDTLKKIIKYPDSELLDIKKVISVLVQLISGLSYAHSNAVVHRDLKPENILVTSQCRIKITDLGLSCAIDSDKGFTKTGETIGTPYYMSPELFAGDGSDIRTDIYSLGIIAYEMVCRKKPFVSENYLEIAQMHMGMEPVHIRKINPAVPEWYCEFVSMCMKKRRDHRFQSMDEVLMFLYENSDISVAEELLESPFYLGKLELISPE
jgi:eukaryotic-like serine/threonine-protein kinase